MGACLPIFHFNYILTLFVSAFFTQPQFKSSYDVSFGPPQHVLCDSQFYTSTDQSPLPSPIPSLNELPSEPSIKDLRYDEIGPPTVTAYGTCLCGPPHCVAYTSPFFLQTIFAKFAWMLHQKLLSPKNMSILAAPDEWESYLLTYTKYIYIYIIFKKSQRHSGIDAIILALCGLPSRGHTVFLKANFF